MLIQQEGAEQTEPAATAWPSCLGTLTGRRRWEATHGLPHLPGAAGITTGHKKTKREGDVSPQMALLRTKWAGRLRQANLLPGYKCVTVATKSQTS